MRNEAVRDEWPLTVYIAGPISSDPDYREKFAAAAERLRAAGYIPVNPAVLPYPGFSYEAYMRMSGAMLRECRGIHMLRGWQKSPGAVDEHAQAVAEGKIFVDEQMRQHKTPPAIENLHEREMMDNMESSKDNIKDLQPEKAEPAAASPMDKPDPLKEIMDKLEQGVTDLFDSDSYKRYLNTLAKFHNYSLNNTILITMQ